MAKWTLPEGRKPLNDADMTKLERVVLVSFQILALMVTIPLILVIGWVLLNIALGIVLG